jgi:hypothetical protein
MMASSVHDRWLMRHLPALVRNHGFEVTKIRGHVFVEVAQDGYMLTIVDRGADLLHAAGHLGAEAAAAMKDEARRRVETGSFFGQIAYGSLIARKPAL